MVQIRWNYKKLLLFIRPLESNAYNIFDPIGLKFLTRLRLVFSHLNEHRFRHNFQDCMNPLCSRSLEIEDTLHYLLRCHHFSQYLTNLMNSIKSILGNFILLYGDWRLDRHKNKFILETTLTYTKSTGRFSGSILIKDSSLLKITPLPTKLTSLTCISCRSYVSPVNTEYCRGSVVCFYVLV